VTDVNVFEAELQTDEGDPAGYNASYVRLGPLIGASKLGMTVYGLPPGQSICPYHYEYGNEEWLLVLEGTPTLRHPGGEDDRHRAGAGPSPCNCRHADRDGETISVPGHAFRSS